MTTTWRFELRMVPMSMNERERASHWKRRTELQQIIEVFGWQAKHMKVPAATARRHVAVEIVKGPRSRRKDDPANREARAKSILDALVRIGVLVDDSDEWLEWHGVVESRGARGPLTWVRVWDDAPDGAA